MPLHALFLGFDVLLDAPKIALERVDLLSGETV